MVVLSRMLLAPFLALVCACAKPTFAQQGTSAGSDRIKPLGTYTTWVSKGEELPWNVLVARCSRFFGNPTVAYQGQFDGATIYLTFSMNNAPAINPATGQPACEVIRTWKGTYNELKPLVVFFDGYVIVQKMTRTATSGTAIWIPLEDGTIKSLWKGFGVSGNRYIPDTIFRPSPPPPEYKKQR